MSDRDHIRETRQLLVEAARRHSLGGVAVAIVRKGEPPAFDCLGLADRASNTADRHRHRVPHCLDLEDDDGDRPDAAARSGTVRTRRSREQVPRDVHDRTATRGRGRDVPPPAHAYLGHRRSPTGVRPRSPRSRGGWASRARPALDLATIYRGTLRPDSVTGAKWAYANHGFAVLGQLIEDIAGRPFAEHMLDHAVPSARHGEHRVHAHRSHPRQDRNRLPLDVPTAQRA